MPHTESLATTQKIMAVLAITALSILVAVTPKNASAELLCPQGFSLQTVTSLGTSGQACVSGSTILIPYDTKNFQGCGDGETLTPYRSATNVLAKCVKSGQTIQQGSFQQSKVTPVKCDGTLSAISSPWTCFWRLAFSWTGAGLIWVGVKIAVIAGGIFEVGFRLTIVEFGKLLQTLKPGIDAGWTAMRDIANIIIIGLFVFIAINIILGVKEFGEKKAIAKVLIVAVLINFSLLFTKVIVDASNFTAYQFYNSMVKGTESQNISIAGYSTPKSVIAPRFMQLMGVQGIIDSKEKLSKIADSNDNAFYALFYGLLSFIFLIAVSAVFLYGAFLIVSRAIMIVFLMLTSALAFAAWLIPQQYVGSSFKKWWESLLKTAFFAPILIAFLWMTLKVSESLVFSPVLGKEGEGTLGKLASNASSEANTTALLFFLLVLGLLFASMMTANVFAKSISGFRFATAGVGGTLLGASRLGGLVGRNVFGWPATGLRSAMRNYMFRQPTAQEREAGITYDERRQGIRGYLGRGVMRGADFASRTSFDALRTKPLERLAGAMGTPRGLIEATRKAGEGGMEGVLERKARAADELARRIGPTEEQRAEMRQQTQQQINQQQQGLQQLVDAQQRTVREIRAQERPGVEEAVRGGQAGRPAAEGDAREVQRRNSENTSNLRSVERRIERAERDAEAQGLATTPELQDLMRERNQLSADAAQIQQDLERARRALRGLDDQARELAEHQLDEHVNVAVARTELQQREADLRAHRERTRNLPEDTVRAQDEALRRQLLWDPRARPFVPGEMRGQQRRRDLRILADEVQRDSPRPQLPPTPPPAPAT